MERKRGTTDAARAEAARLLGQLGGVSRAKSLTAERRQAIARKAAAARWKGQGKAK